MDEYARFLTRPRSLNEFSFVCLFVCLFVCEFGHNSKNIDPINTKLGQYMHLGPGHKPIVFGGSRSKVKVTEVKKPRK